MRFTINVLDQRYQVFSTTVSGPIELGRQRQGEPEPYCQRSTSDGHRLILAALRETTVSRQHVLLEPLTDGKIRIKNCSARGRVTVEFHGQLKPGDTCTAEFPVSVKVARKRILHLESTPPDDAEFAALSHAPKPPLQNTLRPSILSTTSLEHLEIAEVSKLVQGLETALGIMQSCGDGADFLTATVQAAADVLGLDCAAYLRLHPSNEWCVAALEAPMGSTPPRAWTPHDMILQHVQTGLQTYRYVCPETKRPETATWVAGLPALVAAPVLGENGQLIGALYGERLQVNLIDPRHDITELEATLMQTIAGSISAMLARKEQDVDPGMDSGVVDHLDYFPLPMRDELHKFPDLLEPQKMNVTVGMIRLKNFSILSRRLKPRTAARCIDGLLSSLTEVIEQQLGTLLDFAEGEATVLWGAPIPRDDHANLACRTIPAILEVIESHGREWFDRLDQQLSPTVCVHSETTIVGPNGMPSRFRYGPFGDTLPRIRRLIDAAEMADVSTVITGSTSDLMKGKVCARRLGGVRLTDVDAVMQLHQFKTVELQNGDRLRTLYETALAAFEDGEFGECIRSVSQVLQATPDDVPSLRLQQLAGRAYANGAVATGWVWNMAKDG